MKNIFGLIIMALAASLFVAPLPASAEISLPRLVSDHMVLQRDSKVRIWGWASPGEKVTVKFMGISLTTTTPGSGRWEIVLPAMKAGGPYSMTLKASNTLTINDILIGDVWLCGGQSNMEFKLNKVRDRYAKDISTAANYPIREFAVKEKYGYDKVSDVSGSWQTANPETVLQFTAVGYFFAQSLYERYKVPIGLLYSAWPGTPAESWISEEGLKSFPRYTEEAKKFRDTAYAQQVLRKDKAVADQWYANIRLNDQGAIPGKASWASLNTDTTDWKSIRFPGYWETQGLATTDGVVWVKKTITVPKSMTGKELKLSLGLIDDIDTTYFNGEKVGTTDNKYNPRRYVIPARLVKEGLNTITIRIIDNEGTGGIVKGKIDELSDGKTSIDLSGNWIYKIGYQSSPLPVQSFTRIYYKPAILYHPMIEPLTSYTIKGAIWYQGEANTGWDKAIEYRKLLPTMIDEWRRAWNQGNFPFLIVQLPNFMKPSDAPQQSGWALLRESQSVIAANIPNCGLAVIIDLGEENDIHPSNKKDVGKRLALSAEKVAYPDSGTISPTPIYRSMRIDGNKIILSFNKTGKGLVAKGGTLKQFAIAGADKHFVWGTAEIQGSTIVVSAPDIPAPVAVRYAWADNPIGCNLYSAEDVPVSPFRTDDWNK
jgi:sialate O-acetylesterase